MLQTLRDITIEPADLMVPDEPHSDYERVRRIIAFISERWREQPSLEAIADHVGLSTTHVHHLFRRWAGLSPKAFLQAITLDNAKALLADSASVLDATYELGLSGPARLHDLFVTHEAMTPGDYKTGGAGLTMRFGFHPSPFGEALLIVTDRGLAGLGFVDDGDRPAALADMTRRWPKAEYVEDPTATAPVAKRIFSPSQWQAEQPLRVVLIGTDFEVRVWQTLLLRGPLPPGARPLRRAHGLPLGAHPQAGDPGVGSGAEPERERSVEFPLAKGEVMPGFLGDLIGLCYPPMKSMLLDERRLPWAHRSRGSGITSRTGRS
jgi:AraC family transcriptional regulator, regulatory protein of adaptative response / methylated-DNA-[protein]-cysteine methyltransferase